MFKQNPLFPCVIPIDQIKRYKERKEEDVGFHQCVADAFRNFFLSSLCFSRRTDWSEQSTVMPEWRSFSLWFLGRYVWHTVWLQPRLEPMGSAYVAHLHSRKHTVSSKLRLRMNGGNTYSFFSRAKSSCSPSTSIRSFSDAGCFWGDNREEK